MTIGAFPSYTYRPIDAIFYGIDSTVSIWPKDPSGSRLGVHRSRSGSVDRGSPRGYPRRPGSGGSRGSSASRRRSRTPSFDWSGTSWVSKTVSTPPSTWPRLPIAVHARSILRDDDRHQTAVRIGVIGHNITNTTATASTRVSFRYYADHPAGTFVSESGSTSKPRNKGPT